MSGIVFLVVARAPLDTGGVQRERLAAAGPGAREMKSQQPSMEIKNSVVGETPRTSSSEWQQCFRGNRGRRWRGKAMARKLVLAWELLLLSNHG